MKKEKNLGSGKRIRMWRKSHTPPMKSFQLAELIKISQGSLSDIENNKSNPSAPTIVKFMELTDINVCWMLTGNEGDITKGEAEIVIPPTIIHVTPGSEFLIRGREKI